MPKVDVQTLKGFRDFLPQQMKVRQRVIGVLKKTFELYGFEPLETPTLEYEALLAGKYGEEGDKLMYRFEDNGGRKVAMRYDQTVPLARVIAEYQNELPMPFKRYQIQPVWRADNTQRGRFREFLQCDADIVGTDSVLADAEIVKVVFDALTALGFKKVNILINDRRIFSDLVEKDLISEKNMGFFIRAIDKIKKIGREKVLDELVEKGITTEVATYAMQTIEDQQQTPYITNLFKELESLELNSSTYAFDPTLARGLDYYTGFIFEVEVEGYDAGSVCGGGRYDKLIGMFSGTDIPAVGFAFGFDRVIEAMKTLELDQEENTNSVLVTVFSPELKNKSTEIAVALRRKDISAELYLDENVKMEKQLKYADKKGIGYVAIIGPEENEKNTITLKNMRTGEQENLSLDDVIKKLK